MIKGYKLFFSICCLQTLDEAVKARSLALRFMKAYPCCIRAIPYERNGETHGKAITMCMYVISDGKETPHDPKEAALWFVQVS